MKKLTAIGLAVVVLAAARPAEGQVPLSWDNSSSPAGYLKVTEFFTPQQSIWANLPGNRFGYDGTGRGAENRSGRALFERFLLEEGREPPFGFGNPPGRRHENEPPRNGPPVTDPPAVVNQEIATPEPITMILIGTGLAGLGIARHRRKSNASAIE